MEQQTIAIAVKGAGELNIDTFESFQGDLKTLAQEDLHKFKKNILENGYSFTIHVWQNEGHNYIIDGHQRLATLKHLKNDGYIIPDIPVSFVMANSFAEAKKKVLAGASEYGHMTESSLSEFVKTNELPLDDILSTFTFSNIDMDYLLTPVTDELSVEMPEIADAPEMRSAGENIKKIQLVFETEAHAEFMEKISLLSQLHGVDSVTDTVLAVVREAARGL